MLNNWCFKRKRHVTVDGKDVSVICNCLKIIHLKDSSVSSWKLVRYISQQSYNTLKAPFWEKFWSHCKHDEESQYENWVWVTSVGVSVRAELCGLSWRNRCVLPGLTHCLLILNTKTSVTPQNNPGFSKKHTRNSSQQQCINRNSTKEAEKGAWPTKEKEQAEIKMSYWKIIYIITR